MNHSIPGLPVHHQLPELTQTQSIESVMTSNHLICCRSHLSCPQSFQASRSFQKSLHFTSGGQSIGVSASATVLPMNIQDWFRLEGLVGSSCCPKDSQESSPAPQFKSTNSLALRFLYSPTLTSIHDYWKDHSFDYTDLCWKTNVFAFNTLSRFVIAFLLKSR